MPIEIIDSKIINSIDGVTVARHVDIVIRDNGVAYILGVGGLPLTGDLQAELDGRFAELWQIAQEKGQTVDLFELRLKRVCRAFALVVMDEINILRQREGLPLRTAGQIDDAIRAKLRQLVV